MIAKIQLKGMHFYAFHGVSTQEKKVGNQFVVDILLTAPLENAVEQDALEETIDYSQIYAIVKEEMAVSSNLLEHVAGRIMQHVKRSFPQITEIEVAVTKKHPPFGGDVRGASVLLKETY
ncbi:dihydroneopterin aldolase [Parabacteroides sp. OttesenSCG-928-G07]|nr:dihydroneopterin aldolase [Parabacteroides sp. OttesenSCG-928-G21]MDL2277565.1 dihydroneopterin aldolase [Parabacteroides sp. OttesenSCG-928-G07]